MLRNPNAVTDIERNRDGTWLNFAVRASAALSQLLTTLGFIENDMLCADVGDKPEHVARILDFYHSFGNDRGPQRSMIAFLQMLFYFLEQMDRDPEAELLGSIVTRLRETLAGEFDLEALADELNTNTTNLRRKFRAMYGCSIIHYRVLLRIEKGKELLLNGKSVKQAAYELGYHDEYAFAHQFKQIVGTAPGKYQKSARSFITVGKRKRG